MRIALALGAVALLVAALHAAAVRGLADLAYFPARSTLDAWGKKGVAPSAAQWVAARDALAEARRLEPDNPLFVEETGRLYEKRVAPADPAQPVVRGYLERALDAFRQAARMRPASPYAWSNVALVKFRLGERDAAFRAAIENAARLGPWEPGVQRTLADIGFAAWRGLDAETRAVIAAAIERGMVTQPKDIERLAKTDDRAAAFCADPLSRGAARLCAKR
jgi:tetratricopeptide (TPR) repeat protein